MKSIVEYLKGNDNEWCVDGFAIIDRNNETIMSRYGEGELLKAIHELKRLKDESPSDEYWLIATINGGYYDLDDPGNYLVLKSYGYNDKDEYYGINPKYNEYLR